MHGWDERRRDGKIEADQKRAEQLPTLAARVKEACWGFTNDEKNIVLHYLQENPQVFIDYAQAIKDTHDVEPT